MDVSRPIKTREYKSVFVETMCYSHIDLPFWFVSELPEKGISNEVVRCR